MNLARPLRVCMITTFYPPYNFGGDGIYVQRLANELAARGHSVTVIHSLDAYYLQSSHAPAPSPPDHPNVTVHRLASRAKLLSSLVTQQTGVPLMHAARLQAILGQGFDVINYHNVSLVGGAQVLTYGKGIKLYTLHEYWLVCQTHVLFRDNRAACTAPACVRCSLAYRRPPQGWRYTALLRRAIQHVDTFIAPSRFCRDAHLQRGLAAPITHLPFFVPDAALAPRDETMPPYFLFVGRLEKLKGLQTLVPLFRNYARARLVIAGNGSMAGDLRALAQTSPNIQFLGRVTGAELQKLYRNAVALIIPSLCYEAFPTVMLESFQQRTPVIVRNLGAMPEMVADSGGGLVYETEAELVAALERLLDDAACREQLSVQGYATYQGNWTAEIHLRRYLALIENLMAKHPRRV